MIRSFLSPIVALILTATSLCWANTVMADPAPTYSEGSDYVKLRNPLPVSGEKTEVRLFFVYLTERSGKLDVALQTLFQDSDYIVSFQRTPANYNPQTNLDANAFYTAEALGLDHFQEDIYAKIKRPGFPHASSRQWQYVFQSMGIEGSKFNQVSQSFGVAANVRKSQTLLRQSESSSFPSVVVAGKYRIRATNIPDIVKVADFLIKKERETALSD